MWTSLDRLMLDVAAFYRLTKRQREVARMYAEGYSYAATADRLFIGEGTVKGHMIKIYKGLNMEPDRNFGRQLTRIVSMIDVLTLLDQERNKQWPVA